VSRDGKYALYDDADESIRVVQLADGTAVPFTAKGARARFAPDGKSIVYISMDGKQIVSQPFPAASGSKETVVVPANLDYDIETFALAPDGQHITVSYAEPSVGLVMATNVPDMSGGK
jgi:hypothetical protein